MKVLLTGATSFTGAHIARALRDAGFEVTATLTKRLTTYSAPLMQRRRNHSKVIEWVEEAPFGSERLNALIRSFRPDVFINHGASIRGYREPSFDCLASVETSLRGGRETIEAFADAGGRRFIHTGSVFEPDEGGPFPAEAISLYGVSKAMAWQPLRFFAAQAKLAVSKIVIPNPVGAFENEDRLIPLFVKTWKSGGVPSLRTPQLVRDNLPAPWLARHYVEEAERGAGRAGRAGETLRIRRPGGYVLSNEDFLKLVVAKFHDALGRALPFEIDPRPVEEPIRRVNSEPSIELKDPAIEREFWQEWADSFSK